MFDWHYIPKRLRPGLDASGLENRSNKASAGGEPISIPLQIAKEIPQNSYSARLQNINEPPKIVFDFSEKSLDSNTISKWFKGVNNVLISGSEIPKKDLTGRDSQLRGKDISKIKASFVVISDYNTLGLNGNWFNRDGNDYYQLLYDAGKTNKKPGEMGGAGIGKKIYEDMSQINSFFIFSIRDSDCAQILTGKSKLFNHEISKKSFTNEGYYGKTVTNENQITRPVSSTENEQGKIDEFKNDFNITRSKDQTGTDFIIPFQNKIDFDLVLKGIICTFSIALVKKQFSIEIIKPDKSITKIQNFNSLKNTINNIDWSDEKKSHPLIFLDDVYEKRSTFLDYLQNLNSNNSTEILLPQSFAKTSNDLTIIPFLKKFSSIRARLETQLSEENDSLTNQNVILRIPVELQIKDKKTHSINDYFDIQLQKISEDKEGNIIFIRDSMIIPGQPIKLSGFNAYVMLSHKNSDDPEFSISEFLRQCEDANHLGWDPSLFEDRAKFTRFSTLLNLVKFSAKWICEELNSEPNNQKAVSDELDFYLPSGERQYGGEAPDLTAVNKPNKKIKTKPLYWESHVDIANKGFKVISTDYWKKLPVDVRAKSKIQITFKHNTPDHKTYHIPAEFNFLKQIPYMIRRNQTCNWRAIRSNVLEFYDLKEQINFSIESMDEKWSPNIYIKLIN